MNIASSARPRVALITGPTASGKSALALSIAARHGGTIINADSAQVYADLRLVSARPSAADEARAPHRLFGHVDGAAPYSAAIWAAEARHAIAEAHAAGQLPILVGGTGLYLRTLLDGIAPIPDIDDAVRREVRALPVADAHRLLASADPAAAARLAPTDTTRVARALEVVRATGRTLDEWQAARTGGIAASIDLTALVLLPDRDWLFARCDRRLAAMIADGAADEVRALMQRDDIATAAPVRRAIGVREIAGWLAGDYDVKTALAAAQIATRQYAKRQYTWFRNQPPVAWLRTEETENHNLVEIFETKFLH